MGQLVAHRGGSLDHLPRPGQPHIVMGQAVEGGLVDEGLGRKLGAEFVADPAVQHVQLTVIGRRHELRGQ